VQDYVRDAVTLCGMYPSFIHRGTPLASRGTPLTTAWQPSADFERKVMGKTGKQPEPVSSVPRDVPEKAPSKPAVSCATNNIPGPVSYSSGVATTTQYWDCSGGGCGCGFNPCGSQPFACTNWQAFGNIGNNELVPITVPATATTPAKTVQAYLGTAAASRYLFNDGTTPNPIDWDGQGCGKCYLLTGPGDTPSDNKYAVVKITNSCPPNGGNVQWCSSDTAACAPHFDIAVPGDGLGGESDVCTDQYPQTLGNGTFCSMPEFEK
jgi:hypothetical protein